jgi:hypothetical protein
MSDPHRHKADERSEKHDGCRPMAAGRWSDGQPEATEIGTFRAAQLEGKFD